MIVGCPREVKDQEFRVALTPAGTRELVKRGHEVRIEHNAGLGSGFPNSDYEAQGATIVDTAAEAWDVDMVVKVKEPQSAEFELMREGQLLFTYLHLAAEAEVAQALQRRNVTAFAYENVTAADGSLPLLTPMSEVAGRLATQVGAYHLMQPQGGAGLLLGGVPGTAPANVVVVGGGVAGENALQMALGLGADVSVFDVNLPRLRELSARYGAALRTRASNEADLGEAVRDADLVIGTVLIPGAAAPKLVTTEMISDMREGSVLVDVAIDQGGCFAHSRPTSHTSPTFTHEGKVFYCVTNMPGATPRTSTHALTNATVPFILQLADAGLSAADHNPHLKAGLNTHEGAIVHPVVAKALGA